MQGYRPRWHIENDGYRELKEAWGLEEHRWGRDAASAHCRTTLTVLAFNTAQVYRGRRGAKARLPALVVGVLIFWRSRDDPAALAMSLLLVTLPQAKHTPRPPKS